MSERRAQAGMASAALVMAPRTYSVRPSSQPIATQT
jgi:hypothetical protein